MKSPLADQGAQGAHFDGQGSLVKLPGPEQKPQPMAMDQLFYKLGNLFTSEDLLASMIWSDLKGAGYPEYAHQFMAGQVDVRNGRFSPSEAKKEPPQDEIKVGDQFRCLASGQIFTICEMVTDGPLVVVCCNGTTHRFSSGSALKEACLYERLTPEQQIDELMTREGE